MHGLNAAGGSTMLPPATSSARPVRRHFHAPHPSPLLRARARRLCIRLPDTPHGLRLRAAGTHGDRTRRSVDLLARGSCARPHRLNADRRNALRHHGRRSRVRPQPGVRLAAAMFSQGGRCPRRCASGVAVAGTFSALFAGSETDPYALSYMHSRRAASGDGRRLPVQRADRRHWQSQSSRGGRWKVSDHAFEYHIARLTSWRGPGHTQADIRSLDVGEDAHGLEVVCCCGS
jgi:hypothetical protein